ncbi:uncharacterized protein LOC131236460 isoform X2 [Magnolia sinica]|uniref:uncharacterized protein LOC131236460 isoform X2 n=1 Tax=Magnolia sinica TaxID=86752 RepID=UPI002658B783|nr:uncharacterized protein LOC131236460 isoform X2 [Magnolia sinica]
MSPTPCPHPKMMGRGADGGCGTQEKPCSINRHPPRTPTLHNQTSEPIATVDAFSQAQKALSERSPFDASEESLSRVPTLPVGLSDFLSRPSGDSRRRKHKKSHSVPGAQGGRSNVWTETEDYFRPVTLVDIERLVLKSAVGSVSDSCFSIPSLLQHIAFEQNAVSAGSESCENTVQIGSLELMTVIEESRNEVHEMEIDGVVDTVASPPKEPENDNSSLLPLSSSSSDLHWLLGSKHKVLLTSERPSKKRKLLGEDAGLEKLVAVHPLQGGDLALCHVCCLGDNGDQSNRFILCRSCNVTVHQNCYGIRDFPMGGWLCSWCKQHDFLETGSARKPVELLSWPCLLCPKEGGALKPIGGDVVRSGNGGSVKFAHLFCSLWMPEVYVENTETMEPIVNIGAITDTRRKLVCYLCKVKYGVCIRCSHGTCRTSFHPICARLAKHRMEIWGKVGCDNVELRAFCSKHSVSQGTGGAQQLVLTSATVNGDSSVAKLFPTTVSVNRLPKIKLGCKTRDDGMVNVKTTEQCNEVSKNETPSERDALAIRSNVRLMPEADNALLIKNVERARVTERENVADINRPDSLNHVSVLKKLIEQGKANASHVASEMDISSDSLASILADEHASVSAELQLKIVKWLRSSAHMATSMQCLKFRNNSAVPIGAEVALNAGPNAVKETGPDGSVTVPVKTLPPRRRMKNNTRNSKDNKMVCISGETFAQQNGNGILVDEISENPLVSDDMKKDHTANGSVFRNQDHFYKEPEVMEKISVEPSGLAVSDSSPVGQLPGHEGIPAEMASNMSEMQPEPLPIVEKVLSLGSGNGQADEADVAGRNTSVKSTEENAGHDIASVIQGMPDIKNEESPESYIHPFINKKLMQVQNCACFKQENRTPVGDGQREKGMPSTEATRPACICHNLQPWNSTYTDISCTSDATRGEQLVKARKTGILQLSPEDEVEGEILYFQNRLLDNAVASKQRCEDLILRVVTNLPHELDALRKQRWDAVLTKQFLYEVKEAKKQGRKERRHREAQAVLAAATAAAASSSRVSTFRKDAHDEIVAAHHESPVKLNTVSGRLPRAKETLSRLPVSKLEQSEIFQLTSDFSKEHPRSCDICRRSETMLNPILVCCSCKVAVHLVCYRNHNASVGPWYCELCEELLSHSRSPKIPSVNARERSSFVVQCGLCGGTIGAFRKSIDGQWVHAFCAEWVLESTFRRGQPNPIEGMEAVTRERDLLICCICGCKLGVCIKCNYGNCQSSFHPTCARNAGLYLSVRTVGGKIQHKAYCEKHGMEQRDKAETQQHGAEELQSIKQIRVELEKVRLLCERIIKREKLKITSSWYGSKGFKRLIYWMIVMVTRKVHGRGGGG